MASVVDICNLALANLGQNGNISSISPPEGSQYAETCARFYPIARDLMLEMHNWSFATKRAQLAQLSQTPVGDWRYAYAVPSDRIRIISLLPLVELDYDNQGYQSQAIYDRDRLQHRRSDDSFGSIDFIEENGILYTNEPNAMVRYVWRVTDSTKFTPAFVDALSWLLASYLAGPIKKADPKFITGMRQMAMQAGMSAAKHDANAVQVTVSPQPSWIRDR